MGHQARKRSIRLAEHEWLTIERALCAAADGAQATEWITEFRQARALAKARAKLRIVAAKIREQRREPTPDRRHA